MRTIPQRICNPARPRPGKQPHQRKPNRKRTRIAPFPGHCRNLAGAMYVGFLLRDSISPHAGRERSAKTSHDWRTPGTSAHSLSKPRKTRAGNDLAGLASATLTSVSGSRLRWKRALDLVCVLLFLPVIVLVGLLIHFWITMVSPGPTIFRQTRIGRCGRTFTIYKFRTMHLSADPAVYEAYIMNLINSGQPMVKMDDHDERLIKGARFIRKSGLDELPQLLNVLRGEMSIVGPRPCVPCEFQFYDEHHFRRFLVPAGLTGIWQVRRNHSTTFQEMMDMDVEYVDHFSLREDLKIILMTPLALTAGLARRERHRMLGSETSPFGNGPIPL